MKLNISFFGLMMYMSAMGATVLQPISMKSRSMSKQLIRIHDADIGLNSSIYCRTLTTAEQCNYPVTGTNERCCAWLVGYMSAPTGGTCIWPGDADFISAPEGNGICQFTEPHYSGCTTNDDWNVGWGSCPTYLPKSPVDEDDMVNGNFCATDGACSGCPCACSGHVDCHAYTRHLHSSCSSNPLHNSDGPPPGYSGYSEAKAACEADPLCGGFQDRSCNWQRDTDDDFFLCPVMAEWHHSSTSCVYEKRYDAPRPTASPTCDSWSGC